MESRGFWKTIRRGKWVTINLSAAASLLFADDVVLMASSVCDRQCTPYQSAAECNEAGMKFKSVAMVLSSEPMDRLLGVGNGSLPYVMEIKYLGLVCKWGDFRTFSWPENRSSKGGTAETVMKRQLGHKSKLFIYRSIFVYLTSAMAMSLGTWSRGQDR